MAYTQKNDEGSLFRNEDKAEGSKHPDYKGSCTLNGKKLWISAWLNTGKNGQKYMQLRFKEAEARDDGKPPAEKPKAASDFNDDVPF